MRACAKDVRKVRREITRVWPQYTWSVPRLDDIGGGADFGTVTTSGLKVNLLELEKAGNCTSILPTLVVVNTPLEVRHFCGA